jgi:hypothetical protein
VGDYPSVFSCGKVVTSFTGFNFSMNQPLLFDKRTKVRFD